MPSGVGRRWSDRASTHRACDPCPAMPGTHCCPAATGGAQLCPRLTEHFPKLGHAALRGRPRGRGPAGPHRAGRRRGVRLRHLLRCGSRLATAATSHGITKLALYEPPFMAEVEDGTRIKEYTERLNELLDGGHKGDAVALFMMNVGIPAQAVAGMRVQPGWATLEAIAPTLA